MSDYTRRELFALFRPVESEPEPEPVRDPVPAAWLPVFLRPPGALAEADFLATCVPCDDCISACPAGAIKPLSEAFGAGHGTPAILPEHEACRLCTELHCAIACPTGALIVVAPEAVNMGTARLGDGCWAAMGQPCDYCATACPLPENAIQMGESGPIIDEQRCVGCGACVYYCTATPKALSITPATS